ncbi:MAG TPA: metallophosphoesterase [Streptosporangiaceae bacterium]|nr:metallophosphoesterase [Streptosporangiaceae bacterium]
MTPSRLFAVSDLHLGYRANREIADRIKPVGPDDWLLIAGDVSERVSDLEWVLRLLTSRFARVVWVPGNHDLWTHASDPVALRGEERYLHLVDVCRRAGVLTPEDPYEIFAGPAGPALIAPLFLLYDYTFLTPGTHSAAESLAYAYDTGIVCADEALLHPDPYPSRADWCKARVAATEQRLTACDPSVPLIMVNHYPLIREPTRVLRHPEFAQWCGTEATADWHLRFHTAAVVYGHLHIPRTTWHDGVRFEEVSLGYPREWQARATQRPIPREVLPGPPAPDAGASG